METKTMKQIVDLEKQINSLRVRIVHCKYTIKEQRELLSDMTGRKVKAEIELKRLKNGHLQSQSNE